MDMDTNKNKLNELQLDLEELEKLIESVARPQVKTLLQDEAAKVAKQIKRLQETVAIPTSPNSTKSSVASYVKIINYAWDQSDKFVKLFVTLNNVQNLSADAVKTSFTQKSMELLVTELENKNHALRITNLLNNIEPEGSFHKVKQDMVVVFMKKSRTINWASVSALDKKSNDLGLSNKMDDNADPSQGLMSLMKKMYDDGDDEMKRSIAKAWYDAKDKQKDEPVL